MCAVGLGLVASVAVAAHKRPANFVVHEAPRPLPEIGFEDGGANARRLADFRGKVVLLNVWATWCVPCRREMPTLDRLQATLGGPGFEVVALSIDRAGLEVVRKFYAEIGVAHLAMYIDSASKVTRELGIAGLPATLLIDREGRELGRLIGPAEWDSPAMIAFLKGFIAVRSGAAERPADRSARETLTYPPLKSLHLSPRKEGHSS